MMIKKKQVLSQFLRLIFLTTKVYSCKNKYVIYEFSCRICDQSYIGQTCRPFQVRYREHERSLRYEDQKSALSEHSMKAHSDKVMTINNFDYKIIDQQLTARTCEYFTNKWKKNPTDFIFCMWHYHSHRISHTKFYKNQSCSFQIFHIYVHFILLTRFTSNFDSHNEIGIRIWNIVST